ncbi:hypothetical protein Pan97_00200 [Bremerella volcania]|uniref:Uncharacterized protein n=1 Tax=Bremerella volcania TaxID=2527984 RepID=A0A518C1G2_9BACT|nr:hypothetical protein [Bremerella volcania]QDU73053.1 hypothetical protein Pan97_00200 [Bremerella volcania]
MESDPATRSIGQLAGLFLFVDLMLTLWIVLHQPGKENAAAVLIGVLVGQFGLGCAAILRNESLREGAIGWLVLLVSSSGIVPVVFDQVEEAGYILLFALIVAGVCLALNLLPTVILRSLTSRGGFQFSILHIMLLMTLVGVSIVVASMTYLFLLAAMGFMLLLLAPAAIGCLLVGVLSQMRAYLASMALILLLIGAGWMMAPDGGQIWVYLVAQTLTVMLGGYGLMQVELDRATLSSAATASPLRPEPLPDPLDEP